MVHSSHMFCSALCALLVWGCGDKDDDQDVIAYTNKPDVAALISGTGFPETQLIARWSSANFQEDSLNPVLSLLEWSNVFNDGCTTQAMWQPAEDSGLRGPVVLAARVGWMSDSGLQSSIGVLHNMKVAQTACGYWWVWL